VFPALVVSEGVASADADDEVPRLIRRNTAARNSPAKIPVNALSVVTIVVSVVVVILVNVDIAVTASGVSVEVVKLVSVKAEYIVAVVVVAWYGGLEYG
jgi:uncharacterized membrane protein YGL010W